VAYIVTGENKSSDNLNVGNSPIWLHLNTYR